MQKYFFLDRGFLQPQGISNAKVYACKAVKDPAGPFFTEGWLENPALPWEVRYDNAYPNVLYDPKYNKYRCYYTMVISDRDSEAADRAERAQRDYRPTPGREVAMGYAESDDGIHWVKPALGFVSYMGSDQNNIMLLHAHGTGVMLDTQELDFSKRYKLVTRLDYPGRRRWMAACFSEDGIHWSQPIYWPKYRPQADSHNFPFRDAKDGKYKVITRSWRDGVRTSAICESTDFINWSEPKEVLRGRGFEAQVYSMPVFYQDNLYLGLASIFHEGDRTLPDHDLVDCELAYTSNLDRFDFAAPDDPLIVRGGGDYLTGDFDRCCIFASPPLELDGRLCIYYMGGNGPHTNFRETSMSRAFLEQDKYAYLAQRNTGQEAIVATTLCRFYGERFSILADLEPGGKLEVALYQQWRGPALPGYDFGDATVTHGAGGWLRVNFPQGLHRLVQEDCCIMVRMTGVRLYAIQGDLVNTVVKD